MAAAPEAEEAAAQPGKKSARSVEDDSSFLSYVFMSFMSLTE